MANHKWASDDAAGDLLAGILDDTETDAKAEEERIQAQIQARAAEEQAQREEADRKRKMEAEARISAEKDRLDQAAERRTAKMEALKIEDLKASGDWVDPEILAKKQRDAEEQRLRDEQMLAQKMAAAQAPVPQAAAQHEMPAAPPKSNTALYAILAVALVGVIGAGIAIVMLGGAYKVDNTQYSKSVYKPKDVEVAVVEVAVSHAPKAAPVMVADADTGKKKKSSRKRRGSSKKKKKSNKPSKASEDAKKAAAKLEAAFGSDSPF